MDEYAVLGRIGEGAHGTVMKGRHKQSGSIVALKKVLLKRIGGDGIPESALREIKALQVLDSEYIVRMYDMFPQGHGFVLVFEYMISDLSEMIQNVENPLKPAEVKTYMGMLLRGLAYMHSVHIMHRDLKPANLLISAKGQLKIADFGLSRIFEKDDDHRVRKRQYSHQVATRWYRAPELLYGARNYTEAVDVWSVGCIFGELVNFSPIFPGENDIDQLGLVIRTLGTPNETIWPGVHELPDFSKITFPETAPTPLESLIPEGDEHAKSLFKKFIVYDLKGRISAEDALKEPYFFREPRPARLNEMPKPKPKNSSAVNGGAAEMHKSKGLLSEDDSAAEFSNIFRDLLSLEF